MIVGMDFRSDEIDSDSLPNRHPLGVMRQPEKISFEAHEPSFISACKVDDTIPEPEILPTVESQSMPVEIPAKMPEQLKKAFDLLESSSANLSLARRNEIFAPQLKAIEEFRAQLKKERDEIAAKLAKQVTKS